MKIEINDEVYDELIKELSSKIEKSRKADFERPKVDNWEYYEGYLNCMQDIKKIYGSNIPWPSLSKE